MTDLQVQSDAQDERSQNDAIASLDMADLRKYAKIMRIPSQRDWTKEDFVRAIKAKQDTASVIDYVFDDSQAPKPGHARVLVHRDPSPNHKNTPIHVGVNGRLIQVPRGMEVDLPLPFVEALKNAITTTVQQASDATRENPGGVYKDTDQASYPFQVLAVTPGNFENSNDNRSSTYERRYKFFQKFERWPTEGELKEAMKAKIGKIDLDD
jgi:hypothetical protein